jgi:hypothetical protein
MAGSKKQRSGIERVLDRITSDVVSVVKQAYAGAVKTLELQTMLADYAKEPIWANKAARDLSDKEAFDLVMHHVYHGRIVIDEVLRVNKAGKLIYPKPGQQIKVRCKMAGVEYYQASNTGFPGNHYKPYFTPTPAFAIVLYRLAQRLGDGYYGATRIVWGGIGAGAVGKRLNCHVVGTCVDFYGAYTRHGTFDVLVDWAKKPIFDKEGKKLPAPKTTSDKWGNATDTYYRLRASDEGLAYQFFIDVYDFIYEQCSVGKLDVSQLAEGQRISAGNIIHPDYPGGLRATHQEHMHFQLGEAYVDRAG